MSRHEGVSCDSCMKGNFRGRRFKCLVCYDYDLCSNCFESGVSTTRHATSHPMQCILTRSDIDLYFGGEVTQNTDHNSFTCPFCSKMGFTELTLQEHVSSLHSESNQEVVCPICASFPGGDPNHLTEDFHGHLSMEHRGGARDLISFLDEPGGLHRHGAVRRIAHSRGGLASRTRRHNNASSNSGPLGTSSLTTLSPSARDAVDPISELLSQLSGVRRTAGGGSGASSSSQHLQQLQMELQYQRQQAQAHRQTLDRLAAGRRGLATGSSAGAAGSSSNQQPSSGSSSQARGGTAASSSQGPAAATGSQQMHTSQNKDVKLADSGFLVPTLRAEESSDDEKDATTSLEDGKEEEAETVDDAEVKGASSSHNNITTKSSGAGWDSAKQKLFIQDLILSALSLGDSPSSVLGGGSISSNSNSGPRKDANDRNS